MSARFTVTWEDDLIRDVAERWLKAFKDERRRLTGIANRIDRDLRYAPQRRGFAVSENSGLRLWRVPDAEPPALAVSHVRSDDRIVNVLQILLLP
ncbi:MAG: hypothetical protein DWQ34_07150 [Planctomycetota bacterium]|nr:MAG: hypothetical protein DWQ34_07150 [Planctomycetota bacterium]REK23451.1 MAG: hypothetical protein DWQ41_17020 [Planctomycetota bacterium]REK38909.1 MAG: hypothetical protein DWQ45_03435 [Planctomycetota bacterium]